jgi:hypothetical protein
MNEDAFDALTFELHMKQKSKHGAYTKESPVIL